MNLKNIYKKAWEVSSKNKPLWVIGAAVLLFSAGGANIGSNFSNTRQEITNPSSYSKFQPLIDLLSNALKNVPTGTWVALGISFLFAILLGIIISVVAVSWAQGSLIGGIEEALDNKKPTIRSSSKHGFENIKAVIWLRIIPGLLFFLALLLLITLGVLSFTLSKLLGILLAVFIGLIALITICIITIIQIWAIRISIIENKSGKESFFEGAKMAKESLGETLQLAISNCLIGCCLGCSLLIIPLIITGPIGLLALASIYTGNKMLLIPTIILGIIISIAIALALTLVNSIYTVFNFSTWNILYRQLKNKGKNE